MRRLPPDLKALLNIIDRLYADSMADSGSDALLEDLRILLSLSVCSVARLNEASSFSPDLDAIGNSKPGPDDVSMSITTTDDTEMIDKALLDYATYYHAVDPFRKFAFEFGSTGFLNLQSILYGQKIIDTEFYNEFEKPSKLGGYFRANLPLGSASSIGIAFCKEEAAPAFSEMEQQIVHAILPHLKKASLISQVIEQAEQNDREILKAQQNHGKCGFILDSHGYVVSRNDNAQELIDSAIGVEVENGKLEFKDAKAQKCLDAFLLPGSTASGLINIPQIIEFLVKLERLPVNLRCRIVKKSLNFSAQDRGKKFAMVEISSPWSQGWTAIRDTVHCAILTQREKEVLFSLINNSTEFDAAAELDISINTLRTHRKHVYGKLYVENRRMLINRF